MTHDDEIFIKRPENVDQNLCADKGYSSESFQQEIIPKNYIPYVKQHGEKIKEKMTYPSYKARRWVFEVAHSWFNRFRKFFVRYEKLTDSLLALLHIIPAIIAFRKTDVIYG